MSLPDLNIANWIVIPGWAAVSSALLLWLLIGVARAAARALAFAGYPDHRAAPASPWYFFDRDLRRGLVRFGALLALFVVLHSVLAIVSGSPIPLTRYRPGLSTPMMLAMSLPLGLLSLLMIEWTLVMLAAPRIGSAPLLAAATVPVAFTALLALQWALEDVLLPRSLVWLEIQINNPKTPMVGFNLISLWTLPPCAIASIAATLWARSRGARWFRFEERDA